MTTPSFEFIGPWDGQVAATAIHAGNSVRSELTQLMALPGDVRFREEDPFTDHIASQIPSRVVVHTSRFEVDLNRPRDGAVYRTPEEAWDLEIWHDPPLAEDAVERSLATYDVFYAEAAHHFDRLAERGPFCIFDVHSYNHRRDGADAPPSPEEDNPAVNVGTGSVDRERFGGVVDDFMEALGSYESSAGPLDVRENVRFKGANLARWTHERYPGLAAVLALEFKKTFMDEWTGEADQARLDELAGLLARTVPVVEAALGRLA